MNRLSLPLVDFQYSFRASVLESVHGNQDQAVEILLGMSDPEYRPPVEQQRRAPLVRFAMQRCGLS